MNGPSYFEIQVDDIQRAIKFYTDIFGWQFTRAEGMPIEYWRIMADGQRGGLLKSPVSRPQGPAGTNAYVCSMEVKSFDETSAKILAGGGRIAMDKFLVPGVCWQGYFLDPEGNTFGLFEVTTQTA